MSPNPSPPPAVRIITSYEGDVAGAAAALLALLRTPKPNREPNHDDEATAEDSAIA